MYKIPEPRQPVTMFIAGLFSVVGLLLAVLLVAHCVTNIPFEKFTADPATVFGYNPLFGYISNLGVILWAACVGVCLLSAGIINVNKRERHTVHFLIAFGALTAVLMLDDLFMFHESLAPNYLNISEKWVILAYGIYAAACFYHFRKVILINDMRYLILAITALGASVLVDQIATKFYFPGEYFVEDGLKFIGIASWLAYFATFSFDKVIWMVTAVNQVYRARNRRQQRQNNYVAYN